MRDVPTLPEMKRAALFTVVGVGYFALWLRMIEPGFQIPDAPSDWLGVLTFSALLIAQALTLPTFARLIGVETVFRVSLVPVIGAALGGVTNVLEDGLHQDWAFYGFVAGSVITMLGLAALALMLGFTGRGQRRLLAAIPAALFAGQLLFPVVGGILVLPAWLAAAAVASGRPARASTQTSRSCPRRYLVFAMILVMSALS